MTETLINILQTLSDAIGPSGIETEVRRALRPLVEDHVDEMRVDAMGNLITLKRGTGKSPLRAMVAAHMDEVGLMVVGHNGDGTLSVDTIGGINAQLLPGLQVLVGPDKLPGVLGMKAIHRLKGEGDKKVSPISGMAVDIGATSKDEAERLAPVGASIAFATKSRDLGYSVTGKAFDDRAGCTVLTALLQGERFPFDVYGVFTVQEEVGLRGARVASYAVEPDVAIVLEGTIADDLPKEEKDVSPTSELGKGPAITVMDRSFVAFPPLVRHFVETAEAAGIPYQFKQPGIGGTDAGGIHASRAGVPSIAIAVPCRYIHSPVSMLRPTDLEHTVHLVRAALERLTPEILKLE